MTDRLIHVASAVVLAFGAIALGHHPAVAVPLVIGSLLPDLDAARPSTHRSWLLHTPLLPALLYVSGRRLGLFAPGAAATVVLHFVTLGMVVHHLADYVYPREMDHAGAVWPVRPAVRSAPWGLLLLGVAWTVQWFVYLVPSFLPWLLPG